jgi:hypothetical protein
MKEDSTQRGVDALLYIENIFYRGREIMKKDTILRGVEIPLYVVVREHIL